MKRKMVNLILLVVSILLLGGCHTLTQINVNYGPKDGPNVTGSILIVR